LASTFTTVYGLNKPAQGDTPWTTQINSGVTDAVDSEIARPRIPSNAPTVGATTTCDLSLARVFAFTVSQATTLAFSNVPAAGTPVFWVFVDLLITNGAAFVLTFPGSVTWLQGVAPTFPAAGVDRVRLATRDGGTTWYAVHMGNNLSIARNFKSGYGSAAAQAKPVQVLLCTQGSTGATVESSVVSFSLPASSLSAVTEAIRVKMYGNAVTQAAQLRLKFGASYVLNIAGGNNITAGNVFESEAVIRRTAAAAQVSIGRLIQGAAVVAPERATPGETLSGAVTVDVRGNTAVGGGVLNLDVVTIEFLGS